MSSADVAMDDFSVVPKCPVGLTLRKEDFLYSPFSVDAFLTQWNTSAATSPGNTGRPRTLETLRDDLGIYLKVLRSAMIELINEDYADFVNLSTNLVGLDKSIQHLEEPLLRYREALQIVRDALDDTLATVHGKLKQREAVYAKKIALQNLEHITNTIAKVERLLGLNAPSPSSEPPSELSGDLVERIATEINHLNFCVSKCEASSFVAELQPRLEVIGDKLHGSLENQLLESIAQHDVETLKRCLRIFATVDKIQDAETLVRVKIIRPHLEEWINDASFQSDPLGLKGVFQKVMKIVPNQLQILIQLTSEQKRPQKSSGKDFDFLSHSLWPEIIEQIDENLSFIYSAGNPEKFFTNYQTSLNFVSEFEVQLSRSSLAAIERFRETDSYLSFMDRWNLPVYFQIRFQEIALPVETAMGHLFEPASIPDDFRLSSSQAVMKAIQQCYSPEIYLDSLAHRFWKLCLQIMSRFRKGISEAPDMIVPAPEPPKAVAKPTATAAGVSDGVEVQEVVIEYYRSRPRDLIALWLDANKLASTVANELFPRLILPSIGELSLSQQSLIQDGLDSSIQHIQDELPKLSKIIVENVSSKCLPFLKQVSDIPRLYRRTNRELPSKPCSYVTAMTQPISKFHEEQNSCPREALVGWSVQIFEVISEQYLINVSEVLAAVQKMEESLKRLKRVRDSKVSANLNEDGSRGSAAISDDDKIRLQLFLDVKHFLSEMESLGVNKNNVAKTEELMSIVEEATKTLAEARSSETRS